MSKAHTTLVTVAVVAASGLVTVAFAQRAGQSITIQHGTVSAAMPVDMPTDASGRGALVGGIAGYATAGRSSSRRARNALIGSAIGGAVGSSRGGQQGMQYTVDTGSGQVVVISDQTEIDVGDCVTVENAGTGAANIRRAPMALCEGPGEIAQDVQAEMQDDATACLAAKEDMLNAETDEALQLAVRKAKILCDG
ncbi:MAG TPA: hypothetical protein VF322_11535 [Gammaproteobacteria bacterium]